MLHHVTSAIAGSVRRLPNDRGSLQQEQICIYRANTRNQLQLKLVQTIRNIKDCAPLPQVAEELPSKSSGSICYSLLQTSSHNRKIPVLLQAFPKTTLPVRGDWTLVLSSRQGQFSGDEIDVEMKSVLVELSILTDQWAFA